MALTEIATPPDQPLSWGNSPARLRQDGWSLSILLPFAAGYFLSYLFRTINGQAASGFAAAFDLGPRDLGLLTSAYFLAFAAMQLPAGVLIDRYGPRRVQSVLLLAASAGAGLFASAHTWPMLLGGRALIGLGCSGAFVTGVKAVALWLPPERRTRGNASLVMCGGLGAMAASMPSWSGAYGLDWRALFGVLAILALAVSALVWMLVPDTAPAPAGTGGVKAGGVRAGLLKVTADPRFWRVAPLSATVVGSVFAFHGLWAARWLADVAGLGPQAIGLVLLAMGAGLTAGAAGFGLLAARLRRHGVTTPQFFGAACAVFLVAEAAVALNAPVPPALIFGVFAVFGAITVLSFTIIGELFPTGLVGRANGALNLLHLGTAFAMQAGIGAVVALWPAQADGRAPASAYAAAIGVIIALQAAAFAWFVIPSLWSGAATWPPMAQRGMALGRWNLGRWDNVEYLTPNRPLATHTDLAAPERGAIRWALGLALAALAIALAAIGMATLLAEERSVVALLDGRSIASLLGL